MSPIPLHERDMDDVFINQHPTPIEERVLVEDAFFREMRRLSDASHTQHQRSKRVARAGVASSLLTRTEI